MIEHESRVHKSNIVNNDVKDTLNFIVMCHQSSIMINEKRRNAGAMIHGLV